MMNSLLRTVNSISNRKHMLVRESLQQQLNVTVMEVLGAPAIMEGRPVEICDESLALLSAIEAIFLHGLKDSLLNRVTEALSGPDYDAMPQPSFWGPLLVFSHRDIINQIQLLTQVTTEVGFCRAWIRLALNEGLLSSYMVAIRRDNSALKPYYDRAAFIRDTDLVEVAQKLIESIDHIHFDLACNSSLLNFWSSTPLLMAAIWSPPMKSCPVYSAVDIAKTISCERPVEDSFDEIETASSIGSLSSYNSSHNFLNGYSEDDALKIILAKKTRHVEVAAQPSDKPFLLASPRAHRNNKVTDKKSDVESSKKEPEVSKKSDEDVKISDTSIEDNNDKKFIESIEKEEDKFEAAGSSVGNSLINKSGWSTSNEDGEMSMSSSMISRNSATDEAISPNKDPTYDALLKSYHTGNNFKSPNLQELLEKYPIYQPVINNIENSEPHERKSFDEQLGRLAREKGLDLQNYNCLECGQSIGLTYSKANVCGFSGEYFCSNCMATDEHLIPSRVIHNWDLKKYPVSLRGAKYLSECSTLLDLKALNPRIYKVVDTMAQLQTLRVQLNLLRAYLFTCREPVIESLQQKVTPREYLYEHIHQYSVSDLADILNGSLAQQLQKVVEFARNHVLNCWLCSQKGFICEVCNNPKVIYPFDTHTTYRCGLCHAVFHSNCLNSSKPCPKCERRRKRLDLPLFLDIDAPEISNEASSRASEITTT